jgi:hypothetical protein
MYEFTRLDEQPEPQPSGDRFGPPRKRTGADLLDPSQFPPVRPKCFGCRRSVALTEIGEHIRGCEKVSAEDLARFNTALGEFGLNPSRARELVEEFLSRLRS